MRTLSNAAAILALFAVLPCKALGPEPRLVTEEELTRRAAAMIVFLPPEYPAQALKEGVQATVDVVGVVDEEGALRISGIESSTDREDFRKAVADASKFWILRPKYGPDCRARNAQARVRVWFEIKESKPSISFSQPNRAAARGDMQEPRGLEDYKPTHRRNPRYPREAINRGRGGNLEVLLRIDPQGMVEEVVIVPGVDGSMFGSETSKALRQWRFPPREEPQSACYEVTISFELRAG